MLIARRLSPLAAVLALLVVPAGGSAHHIQKPGTKKQCRQSVVAIEGQIATNAKVYKNKKAKLGNQIEGKQEAISSLKARNKKAAAALAGIKPELAALQAQVDVLMDEFSTTMDPARPAQIIAEVDDLTDQMNTLEVKRGGIADAVYNRKQKIKKLGESVESLDWQLGYATKEQKVDKRLRERYLSHLVEYCQRFA
ncbi:MAG TPA: hypothetical protein VD790_06870 [Thermoleophilaceae bacterium]|nr:hypothetical protein [Thermoleophilaceae bacterium]